MSLSPFKRFFSWQRWKLAINIFAIYWPIRLYIEVDNFSVDFLKKVWVLWLLEIPFTIIVFVLWLTIMSWIQRQLFSRIDKEFLVEFGLPAQLATLIVAGILAFLFEAAYVRLWWSVIKRDHYHYSSAVDASVTQETLKYRVSDYNRRRRMDTGLTIVAMLSAFLLSANRMGYKRLEDERIKAEQLKQEALQAQFLALKNQVNPHFLFNNLSILSSLIERNPKLSVQFTSQLAKAYRYLLEQRKMESIKLRDELSFLKAYIFLLHIRFGNKLNILIEVPELISDQYSVAPFTLQLLVENAVKHNRMSNEVPLNVVIYTEGDNLVVTNPIRLRPTIEEPTGLGLKNITEYYRLLNSRPVDITNQEEVFKVTIPLLL